NKTLPKRIETSRSLRSSNNRVAVNHYTRMSSRYASLENAMSWRSSRPDFLWPMQLCKKHREVCGSGFHDCRLVSGQFLRTLHVGIDTSLGRRSSGLQKPIGGAACTNISNVTS